MALERSAATVTQLVAQLGRVHLSFSPRSPGGAELQSHAAPDAWGISLGHALDQLHTLLKRDRSAVATFCSEGGDDLLVRVLEAAKLYPRPTVAAHNALCIVRLLEDGAGQLLPALADLAWQKTGSVHSGDADDCAIFAATADATAFALRCGRPDLDVRDRVCSAAAVALESVRQQVQRESVLSSRRRRASGVPTAPSSRRCTPGYHVVAAAAARLVKAAGESGLPQQYAARLVRAVALTAATGGQLGTDSAAALLVLARLPCGDSTCHAAVTEAPDQEAVVAALIAMLPDVTAGGRRAAVAVLHAALRQARHLDGLDGFGDLLGAGRRQLAWRRLMAPHLCAVLAAFQLGKEECPDTDKDARRIIQAILTDLAAPGDQVLRAVQLPRLGGVQVLRPLLRTRQHGDDADDEAMRCFAAQSLHMLSHFRFRCADCQQTISGLRHRTGEPRPDGHFDDYCNACHVLRQETGGDALRTVGHTVMLGADIREDIGSSDVIQQAVAVARDEVSAQLPDVPGCYAPDGHVQDSAVLDSLFGCFAAVACLTEGAADRVKQHCVDSSVLDLALSVLALVGQRSVLRLFERASLEVVKGLATHARDCHVSLLPTLAEWTAQHAAGGDVVVGLQALHSMVRSVGESDAHMRRALLTVIPKVRDGDAEVAAAATACLHSALSRGRDCRALAAEELVPSLAELLRQRRAAPPRELPTDLVRHGVELLALLSDTAPMSRSAAAQRLGQPVLFDDLFDACRHVVSTSSETASFAKAAAILLHRLMTSDGCTVASPFSDHSRSDSCGASSIRAESESTTPAHHGTPAHGTPAHGRPRVSSVLASPALPEGQPTREIAQRLLQDDGLTVLWRLAKTGSGAAKVVSAVLMGLRSFLAEADVAECPVLLGLVSYLCCRDCTRLAAILLVLAQNPSHREHFGSDAITATLRCAEDSEPDVRQSAISTLRELTKESGCIAEGCRQVRSVRDLQCEFEGRVERLMARGAHTVPSLKDGIRERFGISAELEIRLFDGETEVASDEQLNSIVGASLRVELVPASPQHQRRVRREWRWHGAELIGEGSFGKVYKIFDEFSGNFFAAKCVTKRFTKDLVMEINTLRVLKHDNIIEYDSFLHRREGLYVFLKHASGGSVATMIPLQEVCARRFSRQAMLGLEYLHSREICHMDIKCANLLVDQGVVKLADFGSSIRLRDSVYETDGAAIGTLVFMAPELLRDYRCSKASDIWSFGCTVLEMVTGRPPWTGLAREVRAVGHDHTAFLVRRLRELMSQEQTPLNQCDDHDERLLSHDGFEMVVDTLLHCSQERPTAAALLRYRFLSPVQMPSCSAISEECREEADAFSLGVPPTMRTEILTESVTSPPPETQSFIDATGPLDQTVDTAPMDSPHTPPAGTSSPFPAHTPLRTPAPAGRAAPPTDDGWSSVDGAWT
eukprot:TRINITY_DN6752_c0_g1_i1.p1 TRINITY_DN6752_c0_g1~~TRINITY_DN6752_c0_g1_i1.p1  ORF type:complete len:1472 (+),score=370.62 TRINITY_DN6752_c0_g1_i1:137-4417(+)